jgi:hypothetical protein
VTVGAKAKRLHPRLKIFRLVKVRMGSEMYRAHALNISCGGALLHCTAVSQMCGLIHLTIDGSERAALIAWTHRERLGIQFMSPLTDAQIDAIVAIEELPKA